MRIHANINERTVRRKFTEPKHRKRPLKVIDHILPAFSLRIVPTISDRRQGPHDPADRQLAGRPFRMIGGIRYYRSKAGSLQ